MAVTDTAAPKGPGFSAPFVVILPVLIVFLVLQRHFMRGIATTGLK